jgi:hypothetical protein
MLAVVLAGCAGSSAGSAESGSGSAESASAEVASDTALGAEQVTLHIQAEYEHNILLNVYDVDVLLDEKPIGRLPQGDTLDVDVPVVRGEHVLSFRKVDQKDLRQNVTLSVPEESYFDCKLRGHINSIVIEDQRLETRTDRAARVLGERDASSESASK